MKAKAAMLMVVCSMLGACSRPQVVPAQDWTGMTEAQQREALEKITKDCRVSPGFFHLEDDHLTIQPKPDEDYENVDCALRSVFKVKGMPKLGFVGNEYYTDEPR